MPAWGDLPQEELDADEEQDEILTRAGVEDFPLHRSFVWKFLVGFGLVVLITGFAFWTEIGGLRLPSFVFVPSAIGSLLAIFLVVLGLACLIAGIALYARQRRDPYEMEPIR